MMRLVNMLYKNGVSRHSHEGGSPVLKKSKMLCIFLLDSRLRGNDGKEEKSTVTPT
jgi:hypothetical protein